MENLEILDQLATSLTGMPKTLVHRDFQSENIMVRDQQVYLIDYQGLRLGRPEYDVASLIYDPYVNLDRSEREELINYYGDNHVKTEQSQFRQRLAMCAAQRLMQALGAYGNLGLNMGKPKYLEFIEPAMANIVEATRGIDELAPILGLQRASFNPLRFHSKGLLDPWRWISHSRAPFRIETLPCHAMTTKKSSDRNFAPAVVITNVWPSIDGGRHPVKRVVGEPIEISADVFKDGHDVIYTVIRWRKNGRSRWEEIPMRHVENDRWHGDCTFFTPGNYEYTIQSWPDTFRSWKHEFEAKFKAKQEDMSVESEEGARLLDAAAGRAADAGDSESAAQLKSCAETIRELPVDHIIDLVLSEELQTILDYWPDRTLATTHDTIYSVLVEDERARFSAWYEFFPRSAFGDPSKHATFRDCLPRLDDAAKMGFDVVYLPPIHPIGETARKGKNNAVTCEPGDTGSPWAIGSREGGHRSIHSELGTLDDFEWFVSEANKRGIEVALDFALNCSPDHPYVSDHPDWFFQRPDGSIKYAENPPKKYQDIYPLNFHCKDWKELWRELTDVVLFWIDRGVRQYSGWITHTPSQWHSGNT